MPIEVAEELWRLLGFPRNRDDVRAFTPADVDALRLAHDLMELGILSPDRMVALTRTWGRSFARLAEWQVGLLAAVSAEAGDDPAEAVPRMADEVLSRVDELQGWVWRRHLAAAANRLLAVGTATSPTMPMAVVFVDIVGYTSRSRNLSESELVQWLEAFETEAAAVTVDLGGRVIKSIGDEVLLVADDPEVAVEIALTLTRRGADDDDPFPEVRAGVAYGDVVNRLGDVFGPVVNVASRLTSVARPGTVLVDEGAHSALVGASDDDSDESASTSYSFRRIRRLSVKGYARLRAWVVRPVSGS